VRILPIIVGMIYFFKIKNLINLIPLLWVISIVTVFFSGEKNALGLMTILTGIYFLYSDFSYTKKIGALFLIILFSFTLINSFPQIKKRIYTEAILNSSKGIYGFSVVHYAHYKTAYSMFVDKPFFGHGPKSFRIQCKKDKFSYNHLSCSTHPHNMYLQLLSETGIIGFLFVFSIWIFCFLRLIILFFKVDKDKFKHQFNIFVTSAVFINFFPISTSGNIFNNWISYVYFMSIALFLYSLKNPGKKNA